ncbi:hypothetical protein CQA66_03165 [Helicobacter aurati]|uniref:Uncharacterized protein n=1 Tax=Helicobacter aurati TaxID=137778 RepID=A0A3D8J649_9HELI|nr:hypothetical protein [Helicobacter aurati]RDU72902.1 hypothetical protein CQA66_03165 [Helicobacter aurati]
MTKKNGELAREYIQAADYIIFPISSDSPWQQDEAKELRDLLQPQSNADVDHDVFYQEIKKIIDDKKPVIVILNRKQNYDEKTMQRVADKVYDNLEKVQLTREDIGKKLTVCTVNARAR